MTPILNVVTPAEQYGVLTLEELKTALLISDTSQDDQLTLLNDLISGELSKLANTVFAQEEVIETFYHAWGNRLFLSRWPVVPNGETEDNIVVTQNDVVLGDGIDYVLEAATGILYRPTGWFGGTVVVEYTGGYEMPDGAPTWLKQAAIMLSREAYKVAAQAALGGSGEVRMIAHKESRIMFYQSDTGGSAASGGSSGSSATRRAVDALLDHHRRIWV